MQSIAECSAVFSAVCSAVQCSAVLTARVVLNHQSSVNSVGPCSTHYTSIRVLMHWRNSSCRFHSSLVSRSYNILQYQYSRGTVHGALSTALHTAHYTLPLQTIHNTLYTLNWTVCTVHCTLHTENCTVCTTKWSSVGCFPVCALHLPTEYPVFTAQGNYSGHSQ